MKPLNELIEEMREAAGNATPGPWLSSKGRQGCYHVHVDYESEFASFENRICEISYHRGVPCNRKDDLSYIALANPQNVTRILDDRDDLKKERDELNRKWKNINKVIENNMDKELVGLKRKYEEAMEVVGFYGNEDNWHSWALSQDENKKITINDYRTGRVGGEIARDLLKRHGVKDD